MKRSKTMLSFCATILVTTAVVYGCGDDDTVGPSRDGGAAETSTGNDTGALDGGGQKSGPPALGAQIDRIGRPAINTAANNTFAETATREAAQNAYNADSNRAGWVAAYRAEAAKNLGIYDGLDRNCGNQAFADNDAGAARYDTLGGVLADDRLWLDTRSTTCTTYLAVELNATGASPNADCGGRKLDYDVVDSTYSLVSGAAGVGDGIGPVAEKTNGTTFPYLAAP